METNKHNTHIDSGAKTQSGRISENEIEKILKQKGISYIKGEKISFSNFLSFKRNDFSIYRNGKKEYLEVKRILGQGTVIDKIITSLDYFYQIELYGDVKYDKYILVLDGMIDLYTPYDIKFKKYTGIVKTPLVSKKSVNLMMSCIYNKLNLFFKLDKDFAKKIELKNLKNLFD